MRFGLRFVTQILRESGGMVSLKRNGEGHSDGCTVTLWLPLIASTCPSEAMLRLQDGTSSLQDLTPEQANAALERCQALTGDNAPENQVWHSLGPLLADLPKSTSQYSDGSWCSW